MEGKVTRAPLRDVMTCHSSPTWSPQAGSGYVDWEILSCGHRYHPKFNARMGGTDIGDRKRRRCQECLSPDPQKQEGK